MSKQIVIIENNGVNTKVHTEANEILGQQVFDGLTRVFKMNENLQVKDESFNNDNIIVRYFIHAITAHESSITLIK
jgi:hypothetical protein